jgi:hypothetical protein
MARQPTTTDPARLRRRLGVTDAVIIGLGSMNPVIVDHLRGADLRRNGDLLVNDRTRP